ncbi:MAG: metallophosphoesterase [Kiritimatiellae bacterium]|nr:metallophosphoesterase [Kiritimatiellia bacterium]
MEVPVGAARPFTALLLADTHLTRCDARDDERRNALAAVRRQGEFRDAERFLREALARAHERHPALLLHAGDLIDFTSEANFEAAAAIFAENDWFGCVGNHEFSRYVGEAREDEAYKAASAGRVAAVWPNDISFASRVVNGVNFVAADNVYYNFTETQLALMEREVAKGLPIVLLCHVPLYAPGHYAEMMEETGGVCAYETGVPDELVATWKRERDFPPGEEWRDRRVQQRADAPTKAFVEYIKAQPLLKAVLCGHTHAFWQERLSPTAMQIVCPGTYHGEALELRFT